jgi:hypothetical protein
MAVVVMLAVAMGMGVHYSARGVHVLVPLRAGRFEPRVRASHFSRPCERPGYAALTTAGRSGLNAKTSSK